MAESSVALSIAANASLVGANTVTSLALLRVSPSFAAVTAVTRVERTGLFEAAVATCALAMPAKLPSPVAGTAEQAAPNWPSAMAAALPDGAAIEGSIDGAMDGAMDGAIEGAIDAAAVAGAAEVGAVVALPALEQAPTKATAMTRPAKAPVRVRLFTCSLLVSCRPDRMAGAVGLGGTARREIARATCL